MTTEPETLRGDRYFRRRGRDVSRLENLSDIVFALALTLVVASAVPGSFSELAGLWREAIAVALCFALILLIWSKHHTFFRRYALEDGWTVTLNSALLFLIMVFAYPLKFLALFMVRWATSDFATGWAIAEVMTFDQARWMVVIYSAGYAAVFGVFALLYAHALRRADAMALNPAEQEMTRLEVRQGVAAVVISGAAIGLALVLPTMLTPLAGSVFFVTGPVMYWLGARATARVRLLSEDQAGAVS